MSEDPWPVTLIRDGIILRPMRARDQREWDAVRLANREWLMPWEATAPPGDHGGPATFAALVRMLNRQGREGRALPWLLCWDQTKSGDLRKGRLAGQVTVTGIVRGSAQLGQIGYWIDQRLAGRGVVPTAVAMATDYCFQTLGLHRIEIAIRPENQNSLRVVEKLGFRPEGMRPLFLHINGEWRDHLIFALNAEEVSGGLLTRSPRSPR